MSVAMLPKYKPEGALDYETAEEAAERLHLKKNKPANPVEDMDFPAYRFFPYPTAIYRKWNEDDREQELYRIAGRYNLDLEKRRDRFQVEQLVGEFETRNVGVIDFIRTGQGVKQSIEIVSELREKNEREHKALLDQGWADSPAGVKDATRRMQMKVATLAAEREYTDRNLGEKAMTELRAVDDAADDHVVDVPETRKQLQAEGKLPKEKK
jgi:hypothetical protein